MQKVALIVLDGWGIASLNDGNAPAQANTPNINFLDNHFPATTLHASGMHVGLPWWECGNSEVGHLTMGCGQVVYQYLPRIVNEIQSGYFYQNPAFLAARDHVQQYNSRLHIMGLISSGAVHSYIDHLYALLEFCMRERISKVYLHLFTDGRDAPEKGAEKLIASLKDRLAAQGVGKIASLSGRYYAMDRDNNWSRIEKTYNCLVNGEGLRAPDPVVYLQSCYMREITDEYIEPALIDPEGQMRDNDAIIFFNIREERAKELTQAFVEKDFAEFARRKLDNLLFVQMVKYLDHPDVKVAYDPPNIQNPLGKLVSEAGFSQFRIAETEKYAHVTYFFNGLKKDPLPREDRAIIPSTGGPHYDKAPEMKAFDITDRAIKEIEQGLYEFILINFANPDMVGHTGNIQSAIKAAEVVDSCLGKILKAAEGRYTTIVTSDHGNFEEMLGRSGQIIREHTSNPVPFYLVDHNLQGDYLSGKTLEKLEKPGGFLFDIAPTVLEYLGIPKPTEMIGSSLLSSFV
jgi:2,3-bisphosphoglycerate-independent phosphoglycerate mutase